MTSQIINSDVSTTADNTPVVTLGANDILFLGQKGSLAATGQGSEAIEGAYGRLTIDGEVFAGASMAILLHQGGNTIDIASTGIVETPFTAIYIEQEYNFVTNRGEISGNLGIYILGGSNYITNYGTIDSMGNNGITVGGAAGGNNDIRNYGRISGSTPISGGDANDTVMNAGTINGVASLNGGSDYYDGRLGFATGISGGDGNDFMYGGASADSLDGGKEDDRLYGLLGADGLYGGDGNDTLDGGGDDDTLIAGAGTDLLIGGAGRDILVGGTGRDTASYETATAGVTANLTSEQINLGDAAGDTYQEIENLTGSKFDDRLYGNAAANRLDGGAGADVMIGGDGADTYEVDNAGDIVKEGANAGIDTIQSTLKLTLATYVENLDLLGNADLDGTGNGLDNTITAANGANILSGLGGNDTLVGGRGNDILRGGAGKDTFFFDTVANSTKNVDTLDDFVVADDTIQIDHAAFAGVGTPGILAAGAFFAGSAAHDASDRIIYKSSTGALLFDADGTGATAAVKFAVLPTGLSTLNNFDFIVV